jgi:cytochrome c oxidase subunit III
MTVETTMVNEKDSLSIYRRKSTTNRIGLWLFLLSDAFTFAGLYVARFYLLGTDVRPELNQVLGLVVTAILLVSSFFANRAETAMRFGDLKAYSRNTWIVIALGVLFLLGVVGAEWQIAPFGPADGVAASIFYIMTAFHALHVLSGVVFLVIVVRNAGKGLYNAERHFPVEASVVYWHFIDVVWIFFYPALYLIGFPAA